MNSHLQSEIQSTFSKNASFDVNLKKKCYFHSGGTADCILSVNNLNELEKICQFLKKKSLPFRTFGKGSNLLFREERIKEILLVNNSKKIIIKENQLDVSSDFFLPRVLKFCHSNFLIGFEFSTGIPGSVGGALTMNAGTKLGEIKEIIHKVFLIDNYQLIEKSAKELDFSYRHSNIKKEQFIFSAIFNLKKVSKEELQEQKEKTKEYFQYRMDTQPLKEYSFGSTFKNPLSTGKSAAYWIERAGLKNYRIGDACISSKHANFIINLGKATTDDALSLIEHIQEIIAQKYQINLETEVQIF